MESYRPRTAGTKQSNVQGCLTFRNQKPSRKIKVERIGADGDDAVRDCHQRQVIIPQKRTIADAGDAVRDRHRRQAGIAERTGANGDDAVGDCHRRHQAVAEKRTLADGDDAVRDRHRRQAVGGERIGADGDDGVWDGHRRQAVGGERKVADGGDAVGVATRGDGGWNREVPRCGRGVDDGGTSGNIRRVRCESKNPIGESPNSRVCH